jgi:hypothetical protein
MACMYVCKIYQHRPFQGTQRFTQNGICGLKMYTIWQPWPIAERKFFQMMSTTKKTKKIVPFFSSSSSSSSSSFSFG